MLLLKPIAIKPYLKKYLGFYHPVEPFAVTHTNPYGIFLMNSLQHPTLELINAERTDVLDKEIYSVELALRINEVYWNKYGCVIDRQCQYNFNKFLAYQFHQEFYVYVKNRMGPKGSINKAILTFRDSFDISEDELSFKTIQRAFQRRNESLIRSKSA